MFALRGIIALLIICLGCSGDSRETVEVDDSTEAGAALILPAGQWLDCAPEDQGFSRAVIDSIGEIMKMNNANGVLTRNGYLVAEWLHGGEADKKFDSQSVSKSITSMALGLALRDSLVRSIDDCVVGYYPDFRCGAYSDSITFRQLVTNTSGIALTRWTHQRNPGWMKPGLESHYHNDHWTELARALTYVFGKPLKQVLEENVLNVIGAEMDWWLDSKIGSYVKGANGDSIAVNAGYAFSCWNARDLARVGLLYLNRGNWNGSQVIPKDFVQLSFTEIPQPLGGRRPDTTSTRRTFSAGYGLGWWTMAGSGIWTMSGNGGQFCMVIPKYNIVMTKLNDYNIDRAAQIRSSAFLPLVLEAMGEDMSELRALMELMKKRSSSRSN